MNTFQLNLNITTELMNNGQNETNPGTLRNIMSGIQEVGDYLRTDKIAKRQIGNEWVNETFSLQYENCTLNVDFIAQEPFNNRILKSFIIME